ncbi:peptidase S24 [bacterium]|nr:peptidase S24 [bacterium]|tara:strand:- start:1133 stop:1564 length:432 start_codon:yes stop_codon:yes gene_type:complete
MHCELMQAVDVGSNIRESLPYFTTKIQAGFPSPADDFMDNRLNINDFIIKNPISTYYVKVSGDSMIGAGIFSGDILVVDRSIKATNNRIVVAMVDGDFTVKRLRYHKQKLYLVSENSQFLPIEVTDRDLMIWGVVTFSIHQPS